MLSDRTFGIELECHLPIGKTHAQLANALVLNAAVRATAVSYTHAVMTSWKVTTDGSLGSDRRVGAEVVSPVLRGEEGIAEARRVVKAMEAFGCMISVKCGLHVHVGAGDLSVDNLRNLACSFVQAESAFDAIVPPSRRRDLNQYILSNRTAFGGNYDNDSVNRAIAAFKGPGAKSRQGLIETVAHANRGSYGDRYRKLNFRSLERYNTVEFRQHSGTVDADKVEHWVRLVVAFVDRSRESRPRCRPSTAAHVATKELAALLKFVRADKATREFYQRRRKALSEAGLRRAQAARGEDFAQAPAHHA